MSEKKIIVDIQEDGTVKAETFGFEGASCVAELDRLLKDLAMESTIDKKTEYFKEGVRTDNTVKVKR